MNINEINYTNCCSKLEKIASKRRTYKSDESALRLHTNPSTETNSKSMMVPFISAGSASTSHHIGVNIQTTLSMMKQFRGQNFDEHEYIMNSLSSNNLSVLKNNCKNSGISISQQISETYPCAAQCEKRFEIQENDTYDNTCPNPWTVKQIDNSISSQDCNHQKNVCSCPTRSMVSYSKVMAPFMKYVKTKNLFEKAQNPYTKEKLVTYYESLANCSQELKQFLDRKNNEFSKLKEKYKKLNEKYERTKNCNLIPMLQEIEGELNEMKSKTNQAVDAYKEVTFKLSTAREQLNSSARLLADIETDEDPKPKETISLRYAKVLRKVQLLQNDLKSGHLIHGSGDQAK